VEKVVLLYAFGSKQVGRTPCYYAAILLLHLDMQSTI
jgi:hypothetical protein